MEPVTAIAIGGRTVGDEAPTYVIAEIGSNHDGALSEAIRLIEASAQAGADCVKFQSYRADTLVVPTHPGYATLQRLSVPPSWYPDLKAAADRCGVHFASAPFDLEAVQELVAAGVPMLKIASGDLTYTDLLEAAAATGLPLVVSTGAAYLGEVDEALRTMRAAGATQIALMHCASAYPATFESANVRAVATLRSAFGVPVGFSDHTPGHAAALAAVALGARLIEKHITFERTQPGPDHSYALTVEEFADLVRNIRALESSLGSGAKEPVDLEFGERVGARRGVYAARRLEPGHVLEADDLVCVRPLDGVPAARRKELVGRRLIRGLEALTPIQWEDL
jgi:N-acetylneuraminate synthase/N,N'-diacetyllegionaminate synthase